VVSEVAALKKRPITLGFRYIELARWGYKLTYNWEIIATPWKKKPKVAFPRCELDDVFSKSVPGFQHVPIVPCTGVL
jgi:hypothetical protein